MTGCPRLRSDRDRQCRFVAAMGALVLATFRLLVKLNLNRAGACLYNAQMRIVCPMRLPRILEQWKPISL